MNEKTPPQEDQVDFLEDEDIGADAVPEKRGMSTLTKVLLGATAMAVIMGLAIVGSGGKQEAGSSTAAPRALDTTPGGDVQANSPLYQESLRRKNEEDLKRAQELGISQIPVPETILKPRKTEDLNPVETAASDPTPKMVTPTPKPQETVIKTVIPAPPAAPVKPKIATPQTVRPASAEQQKENPFLGSMDAFIQKSNSELAPEKMASATLTQVSDTNSADATASEQSKAAAPAADSATHALVLRPGDILYAETLTSVNSDSPTPVMAEVTIGKFKGARLVGAFTANKSTGKMVVSFNSMTMPDGTVYKIGALAVDGKSAETAVASDVNHRFLKRYGPILAASFISGYAQAQAQPSQKAVDTGSSTQVVTSGSTAHQSLMAGVAAASSAVANDISAYAAKGPLITLRDGYPIAILMVDPVEVDQSVQNTGTQTSARATPRPGSPSRLPDAVIGQSSASNQQASASQSTVMQAPVLDN